MLGSGSYASEEGKAGKCGEHDSYRFDGTAALIGDPAPKPELETSIKQNLAAVQAIIGEHDTSVEKPGEEIMRGDGQRWTAKLLPTSY